MEGTRSPTTLWILAWCSGASSLALEILWSRLLATTFGSSHLAVTTTLAGFLFGMGLGAYLGGRLADRVGNPAAWLAGFEFSMAAVGPIMTLGLIRLPVVAGRLLPNAPIDTLTAGLSRFCFAVVLLSLPTALMGATFPLMVRSIRGEVDAVHRSLPWLYGLNTLGGLFGVVGGSFWVLPEFGLPSLAGAAAAANVTAGFFGLMHFLRCRSAAKPRRPRPGGPTTGAPSSWRRIVILAGASGLAVFFSEVVWNRIFGIILPNSTLTFALMLALTVGGLALGGLASRAVMSRFDLQTTWVHLQVLAAGLVLASITLVQWLPGWVRALRPPEGWGRVLVTPLTVGGVAILPVMVVLGMAWPVLLAVGTPKVDDGGRRIGFLSLINALGSAVGATLAGWWAVPTFGIGRSLLMLAAIHLGMAGFGARKRRWTGTWAGAAAVLMATAVSIPPFGRIALPSTSSGSRNVRTLFYHEGSTGTVTVLENGDGTSRSMFVDNNAVIGTTYDALKVVRMLGLMPVLLHPEPDRALVIGYGAGVTTAMLAFSPEVGSIDVQELIPGVVEATGFFEAVNHDVLASPKVSLGFGDGRNFLLLSDRRWDVITCDPVHPLYGSAPLYSVEFFTLCREHLESGGQMYQYLPLHHMPPAAFRQAIETFTSVFRHTRVAFSMGHGILIGSEQPILMDWKQWTSRLRSFEHPDDLIDAVMQTPAQVAALMQLDTAGCRSVGRGPASTDLRPVLEFLEPEAFEPDVWKANAQSLIEAYDSPIPEIRHFPVSQKPAFKRLVAGKRLLLFAQLEWNEGRFDSAASWLSRALEIAPEDPEIQRFATQALSDGWFRP